MGVLAQLTALVLLEKKQKETEGRKPLREILGVKGAERAERKMKLREILEKKR